ncbi:hypothetical protein PITC_070250 [Penicillium italicum]|uniref:Uncharacterized protein n=1 Tax=Penicillium italicum TaxID=40296 RepID=A0A0A2KVK5_PENIT|nr:hypothetical protein PITC_070250 [Penicillium italicum]
MKRKMEEILECQPPNSLPKKCHTKTLTKASEAPPTLASDTADKAVAPVKSMITLRLTTPLSHGPNMTLNPGHKREAPAAAVLSATPKRVKKAPISMSPDAILTAPSPARSGHDSFDGIECRNSVPEDPENLRLVNSKALVAVYDGILATLARVDLDLQNLEEMMLDCGYIAGYVNEDEHAEEAARSEQAKSE